ncbi:nucleotide exchange factor GrpE [Roseivivax isoporae]|uniref:Protein GrpE n=1 Tax=Roseivivax isoporae LMG 25204 TaxID=1449351 RepID=X7F9G4_9RHOB|nr:nucleotide exchange factor GrpE [Roseivivax isoporae]ETX28729.1 molecular chaperone GrpE [Roseivivax isoporae LMG 25204]
MADSKKDEFLDDVEAAEAEAYAAETEEIEADDVEADELAALRAERDELRDRFMRALADAENARKRADRERRDAEAYGGTRLARDLLPVYDNLHRALAAAGDQEGAEPSPLIEGVQLTLKELRNVFQKHGIEEIAPQAGDRFDPKLHEAMFEAPVPGTRAGEIIQVSTVGFMLHDRLLRPAQVGVSSTPAS